MGQKAEKRWKRERQTGIVGKSCSIKWLVKWFLPRYYQFGRPMCICGWVFVCVQCHFCCLLIYFTFSLYRLCCTIRPFSMRLAIPCQFVQITITLHKPFVANGHFMGWSMFVCECVSLCVCIGRSERRKGKT